MPPRNAAAMRKMTKLMRGLDFCMLATHSARGGLHARPMSNNGDVEFDGDMWFFSAGDSRKVREIEVAPRVHLSYVDLDHWRFISVEARARIVRSPTRKGQLWHKALEQWFDGGPESADIVLIKVTPTRISYWTKSDAGDLRVR